MTTQTKEVIQDLIRYYDHHTVEKLVKIKQGFVVEDFTKLLDLLRTEVFND